MNPNFATKAVDNVLSHVFCNIGNVYIDFVHLDVLIVNGYFNTCRVGLSFPDVYLSVIILHKIRAFHI